MPSIWDTPPVQGYGTQTGGQSFGNNMFYDPGSTYGAPQSYNTSPLSGRIREQNPQLAYTQYGQNIGIGDQDSPFNNWFYQQYPRFQRGYGQATLQNPFITIDEFLRTLPSLQQIQQQYMMQGPGQRGLNFRNFAPGVRWIGR